MRLLITSSLGLLCILLVCIFSSFNFPELSVDLIDDHHSDCLRINGAFGLDGFGNLVGFLLYHLVLCYLFDAKSSLIRLHLLVVYCAGLLEGLVVYLDHAVVDFYELAPPFHSEC